MFSELNSSAEKNKHHENVSILWWLNQWKLTKQSIQLGTYGEMVDLKRVLMYFDSAMIANYSK